MSRVETAPSIGHRECDLVARGHKPHWIPALKAANGPEELWLEILSVQVDGTQLVIETARGTFTRYNHDPAGAAQAVDFNREWGVLRGPEVAGEDGLVRRSVHLVSMSPIGPCEVSVA